MGGGRRAAWAAAGKQDGLQPIIAQRRTGHRMLAEPDKNLEWPVLLIPPRNRPSRRCHQQRAIHSALPLLDQDSSPRP
jgi:hypothetical protein